MVLTAVDCPASNGLNERLNQTLFKRIRCKINEQSNCSWLDIAKECTDEFNNTTHSVTKFSPNYLLHGVQSHIITENLYTESSLAKDRELAYQNSKRNHNINKSRIDKNRKNINFNIGDDVYVELGNRMNRGKLDSIRTGSHKIVDEMSNVIYKANLGHRIKCEYVHFNKLSPYF
ncbi:hypothetical protein WA026_015487 [Henosepilachna vigintioctopunctata]|uniref:Integrase catalytic domain-containing protein n=1 Tax=Henosepilachna vigintioctopunctata TaxID=420089 RepID=A0AAW1UEF5_9CUCU